MSTENISVAEGVQEIRIPLENGGLTIDSLKQALSGVDLTDRINILSQMSALSHEVKAHTIRLRLQSMLKIPLTVVPEQEEFYDDNGRHGSYIEADISVEASDALSDRAKVVYLGRVQGFSGDSLDSVSEDDRRYVAFCYAFGIELPKPLQGLTLPQILESDCLNEDDELDQAISWPMGEKRADEKVAEILELIHDYAVLAHAHYNLGESIVLEPAA